MRIVVLSSLLALSGCGTWTGAQMALVEQARRGVARVEERAQSHRAIVAELAQLRRLRLDDAFDADVREREDLDADWVIEHRRAYAAAMEAYAKQRLLHERAAEMDQRDLEAIDAALQRLAWLQAMQMRLSIEEVGRDH